MPSLRSGPQRFRLRVWRRSRFSGAVSPVPAPTCLHLLGRKKWPTLMTDPPAAPPLCCGRIIHRRAHTASGRPSVRSPFFHLLPASSATSRAPTHAPADLHCGRPARRRRQLLLSSPSATMIASRPAPPQGADVPLPRRRSRLRRRSSEDEALFSASWGVASSVTRPGRGAVSAIFLRHAHLRSPSSAAVRLSSRFFFTVAASLPRPLARRAEATAGGRHRASSRTNITASKEESRRTLPADPADHQPLQPWRRSPMRT